MTKTIKDNIITALEQWLKDNEYSANEFAAKSGVPSNYLSYMRRNIYFINSTKSLTGELPVRRFAN